MGYRYWKLIRAGRKQTHSSFPRANRGWFISITESGETLGWLDSNLSLYQLINLDSNITSRYKL